MKKLFLVIIIPFLSFGQCEDESACNYSMTAEDFIDGAFTDDCEYVGDYCFLREVFMPEIGGWCAGSSVAYAKWNENCECAETEFNFCPDDETDCTVVFSDQAAIVPVMIPDSIWCWGGLMPLLSAMCVEPGDSCLFRYWNLPYGEPFTNFETDVPYSLFPTSILDDEFDNFPFDWLIVNHFNSVINEDCECECISGEYFYIESMMYYTPTVIYYDCDDGIIHLDELSNHKTLISTIDILGRETSNKGFQLHIYDDGSVEKKYLIK
jgi:hypothetical protein